MKKNTVLSYLVFTRFYLSFAFLWVMSNLQLYWNPFVSFIVDLELRNIKWIMLHLKPWYLTCGISIYSLIISASGVYDMGIRWSRHMWRDKNMNYQMKITSICYLQNIKMRLSLYIFHVLSGTANLLGGSVIMVSLLSLKVLGERRI